MTDLENSNTAPTKSRWKIPYIKAAMYMYGGFVFVGFCKGIMRGHINYYRWLTTRKNVSIDSVMYDPIINTLRDNGYWGFSMISCATGSAFLTATAPISVPILLKYKGKHVESPQTEPPRVYRNDPSIMGFIEYIIEERIKRHRDRHRD